MNGDNTNEPENLIVAAIDAAENIRDQLEGLVVGARQPGTRLNPSAAERVQRFVREIEKHFDPLTEPVRITKSNDPLAAAVAYAYYGTAVILLWGIASWSDRRPGKNGKRAFCACGQSGCTRIGDHPHLLMRHGIDDATTDEAVIRGLFKHLERNPNIGIACGSISKLAVVVVHGPSGRQTLSALLREYQTTLPQRDVVSTGCIDDGLHFYFALPHGATIHGREFNGLEVCGEGAYVIAPPSLHSSGRRYTWISGPNEVFDPLPRCFFEFAAGVWPPAEKNK